MNASTAIELPTMGSAHDQSNGGIPSQTEHSIKQGSPTQTEHSKQAGASEGLRRNSQLDNRNWDRALKGNPLRISRQLRGIFLAEDHDHPRVSLQDANGAIQWDSNTVIVDDEALDTVALMMVMDGECRRPCDPYCLSHTSLALVVQRSTMTPLAGIWAKAILRHSQGTPVRSLCGKMI